MKNIKNISVIGAGGLMGSGISQVFAGSEELRVYAFDSFVSGKKIRERINSNMELFKQKAVYTEQEIAAINNRISTFDNLETAVEDADFIIECIHENMEQKQNLFSELEPMCRQDTIFATNTSVMSITEISSKAVNKARIVGTHFWNPPYLIPLVEVVRAEETSEEVMTATIDILKKVGKHPIRVNKDVPGFVANRLQHALWREAISIVENGIADAATVDKAISLSFGIRLPVLGPLENSDMVGTDLTLAIHNYILKYIENSTEPSPLLKEKVKNGELGFKSGKGFQQWTPEKIEASRKKLTEHLIKVIYNK